MLMILLIFRISFFPIHRFIICLFIVYLGSTFKNEVYMGFIQFISCLYILAVIPSQLGTSLGFDAEQLVVATSAVCGIGSLVAGVFANLPFIIAPPTFISIFYSVYLSNRAETMTSDQGSLAVVIAGIGVATLGWRPLGDLLTKVNSFRN